jgi:PAS domain S-box-containing protein/putative nucleotidyltransferase with HDIG domain
MNKGSRKEGFSADTLFQTLFQSSPNAAVVTRVCDGTIMYVNDVFCSITGYLREEVIGKTTLELELYLNPSDRAHFLSKMLKDGILKPQYAELRRRDGSIYKAIVSAHSFWSENYEYVCCSIRDMSEQIRQNHEQSERDEKLQRLFNTMAQGIIYQDVNGRIVSANPAAERMLGLSSKQMEQRSSQSPEWKTIREDGSRLPASEHPSMIALRTGKPFGPYTLGVYNEAISDHIWLSVHATPLFREGEDKPYQVYVILTDVTKELKARRDYHLLFSEMMDGFALHEIICDQNGNPIDYRYIAVNPAFEQMTGLKACDLIGRTVKEVLPETEQYWINSYGQVALTGVPITFQDYSVALDKYFNVTAYRPAPMQFACIVSDITQQIQYQKEKEQAQEQIKRLAHICDIAPSSILIFDMTGRILYSNDFASRLHGYSKEEMLSLSVHDLMIERDDNDFLESLRVIYEQGEIILNETACTRQKEPIPMLIYAKRTEWDNQTAILTIGTDLTQKTKAEKVLNESLEENRRILDNLQDGFFRADLEGNFLIINPRLVHMYGYDNIADMLSTNAKHMYVRQEDYTDLLNKLRLEGRVTSHNCKARRKDKTEFWVSMNVQYLRNDEGDIIGTEGLIRDITERRKLEQEVLKQHESLVASNLVLKKRLEQSINAISKVVELRDVYTAGHQKRVKQLACQIGARLGFTQEEIVNLSYGALLHDIGKIYIASDILNKPGKITNLEYQILQTHAEYSYNIAREMDLPQVILTMVLQHHERLDGSGYPSKLKGDEIILESRILAVADVVEAMTSHRPYRPAMGIDAALREIEYGRGKKYDACVVDICISLFRDEGFSFSYDSVI